jgi:hypothetical protein
VYFYFGVRGLNADLKSYAKTSNMLNLERDLELYKALDERNLTILKQNLEQNIMFHLMPINTHGIDKVLDVKQIDRLCKKYNLVKTSFKNEYSKKYSFALKELDVSCSTKKGGVR